ncbi:MAG TPA: sigma-70 family RNA polymerase sigma factor [Solirubrobacteraceae bacterium]|nr:sigma-70 family RNA polymerase sigma factor [Solirubrobacteraceae bacterium]
MSSTQQQPAADARERLIESHLPLVRALARRYAGPDAELDDLVQVGAVGLIKASDRFDPARGVAFATFATPTIEGEIRHHLRDRGSGMRIPRQLQRLSRRIHSRQAELAVSLGRSPTVAEIAAALDTGEDEVERALAAERARDSVPLAPENEAPGAGEEPSADSDDRLMLASTMRALDERERRIVYLRFHADKTERQIARELGISQAHVSRLLTGALVKLRASLEMDAGEPGDTTENRVISPGDPPPTKGNPPGRRTKRGDNAGQKREPAAPGLESERLRLALEAWLAAEREDEGSSARPAEPDQPASKPASSHSGRFLVRMPSALHRQLAQAAEREHVSLNRFVTEALATSVSPTPPADEPADARTPPPARTIRMVLAANLVVLVLAAAVAAVLLVLALERGI